MRGVEHVSDSAQVVDETTRGREGRSRRMAGMRHRRDGRRSEERRARGRGEMKDRRVERVERLGRETA